jgi:prepilin-type N-terminal cleavage/methylation domain-containing protein
MLYLTDGGGPVKECGSKKSRGWKPRGFTLVELLVVIAVIALLATILVPSLANIREQGRRTKCQTNVANLGKNLQSYIGEEMTYPKIPDAAIGTWNVAIGTARSDDPFAATPTAGRNPSTCLYLLVKAKYAKAAAMTCPSSGEKARATASDVWDFEDASQLSYTFMNPFGGSINYWVAADPNAPVFADDSPYANADGSLDVSKTPTDWSAANLSEAQIAQGNSPNHEGSGQVVGSSDGSAHWEKRADCGVDRDNIYSHANAAATPPEETAQQGSVSASGPAGPMDSYLVP